MKNRPLLFILSILFYGVSLFSGQQNVSDEAQRYFDRGMAAVEIAKSSDENIPAIEEFNKAIALAPNWAEPYYQLALVQEKLENYGAAITNLKRYLLLVPNASNAAAVRSLVNKIEYKQDQKEGIAKVYQMMTNKSYRWVKLSQKGDAQVDWEIEHHDDFRTLMIDEYRNQGIFIFKDGLLNKASYNVAPIPSYFVKPESDTLPLAVGTSGKIFEYRYPIMKFWVVDYSDGSPTYTVSYGGELSIKGEILSVNPPHIKRVQKLRMPDGKTSVTEFVYELRL